MNYDENKDAIELIRYQIGKYLDDINEMVLQKYKMLGIDLTKVDETKLMKDELILFSTKIALHEFMMDLHKLKQNKEVLSTSDRINITEDLITLCKNIVDE